MKKVLGFLLFIVILVVVVIGASPYYQLYQAKQAYRAGEYDKVLAMMDYEQIQTHLKQELNARFDTTLNSNTSLAQLSAIFPDAKVAIKSKGQEFIDSSVDNAITADNLGKLLANDITPESKKLAAAWAVASDYVDYEKLIKDAMTKGINKAALAQESVVKERVVAKFGKPASDDVKLSYCGFDCFKVTGGVSGQPVGVHLYRDGLIHWKIKQIDVP